VPNDWEDWCDKKVQSGSMGGGGSNFHQHIGEGRWGHKGRSQPGSIPQKAAEAVGKGIQVQIGSFVWPRVPKITKVIDSKGHEMDILTRLCSRDHHFAALISIHIFIT
jgi:hypothetical protein